MEPVCFPKDLDHIWAKSMDENGHIHTLSQHTWEILERLSDLANLRPDLPRRLQHPRFWHVLFWATFLHDWGKAACGFQSVLRGELTRWDFRHEVLSIAFVDWVAGGLSEEEKTLLSAAIVTHHKDFPELLPYLDDIDEDNDPLVFMLRELTPQVKVALYEWISQCATSWIEKLEMHHRGVAFPSLPSRDLALEMLRPERIRQSLKLVDGLLRKWEDTPPTTGEIRPGVLLRGLLIQSDHLASAGCKIMPEPIQEKQVILNSVHLALSDLYAHQRQAAQTAGHALLIAPTGSGKTEAALLWGAFQSAPRIFYTLPYQASMNAMYDRLSKIFPNNVGLLHGRSTLSFYQRLMDQAYHPREATRMARFLNNRSALAFHPIKVFSPYQMLKAAFQLKGFEALLSDFCESAFIFDEIHAYDPKRLAMILETIRYLAHQYGARFLVMSATLPHVIRSRLQEFLESLHIISADASVYARFRRHCLFLQEGDLLEKSNLISITNRAKEGNRVLVVCNTVGRAQQVWDWLKVHLPVESPLFLLHGRFCGRDRIQKELKIVREAGVNSVTHKKPLVVVATQVVEVSLNLDLDVLFTDPAPLEALLQRFGRVNRLGKRPPVPVFVFRAIDDSFKRVYSPIEQITLTLDVLDQAMNKEPNKGIILEESLLSKWLDMVYQGNVLQSWQESYQTSAREFREVFLEALVPFKSNNNLSRQFERLFNSTEVLPEAFYDEFSALKESDRILEADSLLVPLSWMQYEMLKTRGRVLPPAEDLPAVIREPYDEERGLILEHKINEDDE